MVELWKYFESVRKDFIIQVCVSHSVCMKEVDRDKHIVSDLSISENENLWFLKRKRLDENLDFCVCLLLRNKNSLIFDKVILRCLLDSKSMMMSSQSACKKFRAEFSNTDMQIQIC